MFNIFDSKEKKKIRKWKKEHNAIVRLATGIIAAYSKNDHKKAKAKLRKLNDLAVDHVMNEDLSFYHWKKSATPEMAGHIDHFTGSFKDTKMSLMNFLSKYSKEHEALDDQFFIDFNGLVEVLALRIEFEENILYAQMEKA